MEQQKSYLKLRVVNQVYTSQPQQQLGWRNSIAFMQFDAVQNIQGVCFKLPGLYSFYLDQERFSGIGQSKIALGKERIQKQIDFQGDGGRIKFFQKTFYFSSEDKLFMYSFESDLKQIALGKPHLETLFVDSTKILVSSRTNLDLVDVNRVQWPLSRINQMARTIQFCNQNVFLASFSNSVELFDTRSMKVVAKYPLTANYMSSQDSQFAGVDENGVWLCDHRGGLQGYLKKEYMSQAQGILLKKDQIYISLQNILVVKMQSQQAM